jgi:hypothetical protein
MKKIIVATALILTTGALSSQTKINTVPTAQPIITKTSLSADNKELASGD